MDISLFKTFLEVARLRHFSQAAEKLFVTQPAVSARIKQLEAALGVDLVVRKRNDIQLTPAGKRLLPHAETIVQGWNRARQEVALGPDLSGSLAIGFSFDLWPILLRDWVGRVRKKLPDFALILQAQNQSLLSEGVTAGTLDLAFMFEPPQIPELETRQVASVSLILVSTKPDAAEKTGVGGDYIYVDWGVSFSLIHARHFGDRPTPRLRTGHGALAMDLLADFGGSAYLAEQTIAEDLSAGHYFRSPDAPVIERLVHAVYRVDHSQERLLRQLIALFPHRPDQAD